MEREKLESYYEDTELYLETFLKMPKKVQQLILLRNVKEIPSVFYEAIESPIEQIFITAFEMYCEILRKPKYFLFPQRLINANGKKYFVDFIFDGEINLVKPTKPLIIECDGYEFHHSNKEQVIKDNEREYDLKMAGYEILRFSGSQIYRNPLKCAEDAYLYIQKLIKEG